MIVEARKTRSATSLKSPSKSPSKAVSKRVSKPPSKALSKAPFRASSKTPSKAPSKAPSNTRSKAPLKTPSKTPRKTPSKTLSKTPSKTPIRIILRLGPKSPFETSSKTPSEPFNKTSSLTPSDSSSPSPPTYGHATRSGGIRPPKRRPPVELESWDVLEERGKRVRREQDEKWRRRDSVTHFVASIYADMEKAVELQYRLAGMGDALTEEERFNFESSEDDRLDHLREIRLAVRFSSGKETNRLKAARISRGKRCDVVRIGRDVVCRTAKVKRKLLNSMVDTLGWPLVAICLHSVNFRTRFLEGTDAVDYPRKLEQLRQNKQSIEFFARCRNFHWLERTTAQEGQDMLFRDLNCLLTGTPLPQERDITEAEAEHARIDVRTRIAGFPADNADIDHPHEWELSADGLTANRLDFLPGGQGASRQLQRNVAESVVLFNGQKWMNRANWLLRDDPRYRSSFDDPCEACDQLGDGEGKNWKAACHCSLERLKTRYAAEGGYVGDRVELRNMHPIMGTGVRALQHLPANALLEEYTGEIYPINEKNDLGLYNNATYLFHQMRAPAEGSESAMYIDPAIYGNWTRYMNHSCKPRVNFTVHSCGEKILTVVTVRSQPIDFGEEITVNYGSDYFVGMKMACRCGEDVCKLWNADKVEKNKMTLRKAKQQGLAPDWAA